MKINVYLGGIQIEKVKERRAENKEGTLSSA